jgi:ribosomal protein S18 acetylase RimI-like enzyme
VRIVAEHTRTDVVSELEKALFAHNGAVTEHAAWHALTFALRDEAEALRGGIAGYLWGGWLHITMLWVHESVRGQGFGAKLLAAAEAYATEHGCADAYLSTFDFQAPEFYRARGYQSFGELPDYPRGHAYHFLRKRLIE